MDDNNFRNINVKIYLILIQINLIPKSRLHHNFLYYQYLTSYS